MKGVYPAALALVLVAMVPCPAQAEDIVVTVKGMVCSFCAQGLKKTFEKRSEVEGIDVDLDTKLVTIHFKDGQAYSDGEIEELVKDAGYDVLKVDRGKADG